MATFSSGTLPIERVSIFQHHGSVIIERKNTLTVAAAAIACMVLATNASANTTSLVLNPAFPAAYSFYSYTATDGSAQNNVAVAPYSTVLNDTAGTFKNQAAYSICYDINNPTSVGKTYTGHFAYNTDIASMEATYLANLLNLSGLNSASTSLKGAISMAIWEVMFPSSTKTDSPNLPADPAAQAYEKQASKAVSNGTWTVADSNLYPTFMPDDTTSQRFGIILLSVKPIDTSLTATPEPASLSLLLIGGGLILMGRKYRSRRVSAPTKTV